MLARHVYNLFNYANWRTIDTALRDVTNPNIGRPGTWHRIHMDA